MDAAQSTISIFEEQRGIVKFLTLCNEKNPQRIYKRLANVYKEDVVPFDEVVSWFNFYRGSLNEGVQNKKSLNDGKSKKKSINKGKNKKTSNDEDLNLIPLSQPQNANEPSVSRNMGNEQLTPELVMKRVRCTLNKLTNENFTILLKYLKSLPIDTEECLRKVIKVILSYVSDEHTYTHLYAKLCAHLYSKYVPYEQQIIGACPMYLQFGQLLREDCLEELKFRLNEIDTVKYESSEKLRYKLKGLILFISELYMCVVFPVEALHDEYLLQFFDESSDLSLYKIESSCICLTKIGKFLEMNCTRTPPTFLKQNLDFYFDKLNKVLETESTKLPPRIQYMIMDLVDLRNRNWIPRLENKFKFRLVRRNNYRKFSHNTKSISRWHKRFTKGKNKSNEENGEDQCSHEAGTRPNIIKGDFKNESLEVQWKLRSTMNKMTDSNFILLLENLHSLPMKPYLNEIVNIIVDKAVKEPIFCHLYAELCRHLCSKTFINNESDQKNIVASEQEEENIEPIEEVLKKAEGENNNKQECTEENKEKHEENEDKSNEQKNDKVEQEKTEDNNEQGEIEGDQKEQEKKYIPFKDLLLQKCNAIWLEKINQEQTENEEYCFINKLITKGLTKFLSELYKLGVLPNETIRNYLKTVSDESKQTSITFIEICCNFLTYLGEDFEKNDRDIFETYFSNIKILYEKVPKLPYRIWFMLLDLIELHERKWLCRTSPIQILEEEIKKENKSRRPRTRSIPGGQKQNLVGPSGIIEDNSSSMQRKRYKNQEKDNFPKTYRTRRFRKSTNVQDPLMKSNGGQNTTKSNQNCDLSCLASNFSAVLNSKLAFPNNFYNQ